MKVTFAKKERGRYAVLVERDTAPPLWTYGVGYDDELPHDILHFFAEAEFGLDYGIFGTAAAGMPTRVFVPFDPKETARIWRKNRIKRLRVPEGGRSEQLVRRLEREWQGRAGDPELLEKLDALAARWRSLQVGRSLTLEWPRPEGRKRHPPRDRRRPARR